MEPNLKEPFRSENNVRVRDLVIKYGEEDDTGRMGMALIEVAERFEKDYGEPLGGISGLSEEKLLNEMFELEANQWVIERMGDDVDYVIVSVETIKKAREEGPDTTTTPRPGSTEVIDLSMGDQQQIQKPAQEPVQTQAEDSLLDDPELPSIYNAGYEDEKGQWQPMTDEERKPGLIVHTNPRDRSQVGPLYELIGKEGERMLSRLAQMPSNTTHLPAAADPVGATAVAASASAPSVLQSQPTMTRFPIGAAVESGEQQPVVVEPAMGDQQQIQQPAQKPAIFDAIISMMEKIVAAPDAPSSTLLSASKAIAEEACSGYTEAMRSAKEERERLQREVDEANALAAEAETARDKAEERESKALQKAFEALECTVEAFSDRNKAEEGERKALQEAEVANARAVEAETACDNAKKGEKKALQEAKVANARAAEAETARDKALQEALEANARAAEAETARDKAEEGEKKALQEVEALKLTVDDLQQAWLASLSSLPFSIPSRSSLDSISSFPS